MGVVERLLSKVNEMASRLDYLAETGLRSWVEELAALHALQVQAQALLDMAMRMAAALGYSPDSPREAARALRVEGIIGEEDYLFLARLSAFRNIVVHEYATIDMNIIRSILESREYRRVAALASRMAREALERRLDP